MVPYEYIYISQTGLNVPEFMEKINEYGEEGYHLVHQDAYGIFLLERQVYPDMVPETVPTLKRSGIFVSDVTLICFSMIATIFVLATIAWDLHWV